MHNVYFKHWYGEAAYVFGGLALTISSAFGVAIAHNKFVEMIEKDKIQIEQEQKMQDSLRIESVTQKAYFEGIQAVRDSIANTKE